MIKIGNFKQNDTVRLIDIDNVTWIGEIEDVVFAKDNDPEIDSLVIRPDSTSKLSGKLVEFSLSDIQSIEILD